MVEGPITNVTCEEMAIVIKPGKVAGPSQLCVKIISAGVEIGLV